MPTPSLSSPARFVSGGIRAGVFSLLASACSAPPDVPSTFTVRDSLGVRIVENHTARLAGPDSWRLEPQPRVVIGTDEGTALHQLDRVAGAVRLGDGRIVIVNGSPPHMRWFSPTGAPLQSAGRRGPGPGEFPDGHFTNVWRIGGDSVAAWEYPRRRLQVFDGAAGYVDAVRLEAGLPSTPVMVGRLSDGSFISYPAPAVPRSGEGEVARGELALFRVSADGAGILRELGHMPGMAYVRLSNTMPWQFPWAAQPVMAAAGDRWYYGLPTRYEVEVRRPDGELERLIRRHHTARPLHPNEVAAFRNAVAQPEPPERAQTVVSTFAEVPWPDVIPAFGAVVPDTDGNLWVMEYSPAFTWPAFRHAAAEWITWSVFDGDGVWLTDVRIPGGLDVLEIGTDYVLALAKGPLGTDIVQLYDLVKPPGATDRVPNPGLRPAAPQ